MALRTLAARAVRLQTPVLGLSPPPAGRPNLPPPAGGRLISSRNLGGSPPEDAARKIVLENAATLERLEKSYEMFKARVRLLEKGSNILKWSLACIIPVPLVYSIVEYHYDKEELAIVI
ncbi:hypothetical protein CFC21_106451 [Triticum aestivum]|uniref:Calcium uniporter protein n=2 Tax=Triticum aestivum TaxID=4565 RepID=A0A9R1MER3_WHEAT|nr:uncharacterized protein LOC123169270 [Triticum aestivum]KAF7105669.1 hypothetical protein CFC21_106451 [Triticum aestivum]